MRVSKVTSDFHLLQGHRLHLCVAELLAVVLADSKVVPQTCVCRHPWASVGECRVSFQDRVRDVWDKKFGVSRNSSGHCSAAALLQELKSTESPTPTTNVPLSQVVSSNYSLDFTEYVRGELKETELTYLCVSDGLCVSLFILRSCSIHPSI